MLVLPPVVHRLLTPPVSVSTKAASLPLYSGAVTCACLRRSLLPPDRKGSVRSSRMYSYPAFHAPLISRQLSVWVCGDTTCSCHSLFMKFSLILNHQDKDYPYYRQGAAVCQVAGRSILFLPGQSQDKYGGKDQPETKKLRPAKGGAKPHH